MMAFTSNIFFSYSQSLHWMKLAPNKCQQPQHFSKELLFFIKINKQILLIFLHFYLFIISLTILRLTDCDSLANYMNQKKSVKKVKMNKNY